MSKILLMEDCAMQAGALAEWLEISGHDVCVTHSAEEAIGALQSHPPYDLLVTDIFASKDGNSEIERGITLIDKVRHSADERMKKMPIISISGVRFPRSHAYTFDEPHTLGSNVHLAKPLDLNRLSKTIDELLAMA